VGEGRGGEAEFAIDTDRMTEKSIFNSRNSTFRLQQRENTRKYMASSCVYGKLIFLFNINSSGTFYFQCTVYLCRQKRGGSKLVSIETS
jgi:hypothetical protein